MVRKFDFINFYNTVTIFSMYNKVAGDKKFRFCVEKRGGELTLHYKL